MIRSEDLVSISLPDKTLTIPLKGKISPKQIHLFFGSFNEIDEDKVSVITNEDIFTNAYESTFDSEDLVAISFPSIKENIIEVTIEGEILNAGTYFVPSSTNLSDLYTLAGGLRNEAFTSGIQVFREEIKEKQIKAIREAKAVLTDAMIHKSSSISDRGMLDIESILLLSELADPTGRVAGNFDPNSTTSSSFVLKEGDLISIPSISYEVIVQGEVLNSSSFIFNKSMKYKDYIEAAGGFSDYADKRAVFIIRANGSVCRDIK
jgi:SLBB domain.